MYKFTDIKLHYLINKYDDEHFVKKIHPIFRFKSSADRTEHTEIAEYTEITTEFLPEYIRIWNQ